MSLFYSPATALVDLQKAFAFNVYVLEDTLDFPDADGGEVARELAVPYLAGADDIDVTAASLRFETNLVERETTFTAAASPDGKGVIVTLPRPMYLRSVEISHPDLGVPPPGQSWRTLIRGTTGSPPPPLLSDPSFPAPGEMYPAVMAGLHVTTLAGGHRVLRCSGLLGTSWLIQIATASTPTNITAFALVPSVHEVTAQVMPSNLRIQMETTEGDVNVWANPGMLLAAAGVQEVSFLALGKRQLQALLKQPATGAPPATLPLRLKFQSDSGGSLRVDGTALEARYHVLPAGTEPAPLGIGGDWTPWPLTAPGHLHPASSALDLRVQLDGRELNAGSADPPASPPSDGLEVTPDRWVAVSLPFEPLPGEAAGSVLPLASLRLYLGAREAAEASLEIRNDLAGSPGPPVAPPITRPIDAGNVGWVEFVPKKPIPASAGNAPLWLLLRPGRGTVSWYAAAPSNGRSVLAERVTTDAGKTWAPPDRPLAATSRLLAQVYHQLSDPLPAPAVQLFRPASHLASADVLAGATRRGPREFSVAGGSLPADVVAAFAAGAASGKVTLPFRLYSRSVGTLTVNRAVLVYDPGDVVPGGGA